jgi:hypothetical protein
MRILVAIYFGTNIRLVKGHWKSLKSQFLTIATDYSFSRFRFVQYLMIVMMVRLLYFFLLLPLLWLGSGTFDSYGQTSPTIYDTYSGSDMKSFLVRLPLGYDKSDKSALATYHRFVNYARNRSFGYSTKEQAFVVNLLCKKPCMTPLDKMAEDFQKELLVAFPTITGFEDIDPLTVYPLLREDKTLVEVKASLGLK